MSPILSSGTLFPSVVFYSGATLLLAGVLLILVSIRTLRDRTRVEGAGLAVAGGLLMAIALLLPVHEKRVVRPQTRLDQFAPVWQFSEIHSIKVDTPRERAFQAVRAVRADEILLFRTLTWIRRGGRSVPESILNPSKNEPLLDLATRSGFVWLAQEPPGELVVGTILIAPPSVRGSLTPEVFERVLPPGFVLATMNFLVSEDGRGGSIVSTETRVFANSEAAQRNFAAYWRVIYPGSAIIRRMWLRAIKRRAERATVLHGTAI